MELETRNLKLAFVIPRYHVPQAGGAEVLVENLALQLVKRGHSVDVLTTCAQSHFNWENTLTPGQTWIDGVCVRRFPVSPRQNLGRFIQLQQRIDRGWPLKLCEEEVWIKGSVHAQALYQFLEKEHEQWNALIFAPYLFGITYEGLKIVPQKSFLIPCLHPESYADLKIFQEMFRLPRGLFFNAYPEMTLGSRLFSLSEERCAVVGMGFDEVKGKSDCPAFRERHRLGEDPFILYTGRREKGKNTPLLIQYFLTYKKHHSNRLKLVLLGSGALEKEWMSSKDILDLGFVREDEKKAAYREALVTCQPSINESFSIVLMESWLHSTPVLVNAKCDVTRFHAQHSQGGLWFRNYFEFEECLNFFLNHSEQRLKMGRFGHRYVIESFKWDDVINRFLKGVQKGLGL